MPLPGHGVTVGVAVNINQGHSASGLNDRDLDLQIAMDVAEATRGFDPREIDRLKRLVVQNSRPVNVPQLGDSSGTGDRTALLE